MTPPTLYVVPVGTSLLTNIARQHKLAPPSPEHTNATFRDLPPPEQERLEQLTEAARQTLQVADTAALRGISAELNALLLHRTADRATQRGMALLIASSTAAGEGASGLLRETLERLGLSVEELVIQDLVTNDGERFQAAMGDIAFELNDRLPGYRRSGHCIVFNLAGGFKSVSGFLQALATVLADESIYVFEQSPALLTIPRLPLRLGFDLTPAQVLAVRRARHGLTADPAALAGLPETLVLRSGDEVGLSAYGEALLGDHVASRAQTEILPALNDRVALDHGFGGTCRDLAPARIAQVNCQLERLARDLEKGLTPGQAVDLHEVRGGHPADRTLTHQIDAWSDGDARRIFGRLESGVFTAVRLDRALH